MGKTLVGQLIDVGEAAALAVWRALFGRSKADVASPASPEPASETATGDDHAVSGQRTGARLPRSKRRGRGDPHRSGQVASGTEEADKERRTRKAKVIPALPNHVGLLDWTDGCEIPGKDISACLGVSPRIGWVQDGQFVVAAFVDPKALIKRGTVSRIKIEPGCNYGPISLCAITGQAVPVFSLVKPVADVWKFEGFFRCKPPAEQSVAYTKEAEAPAELLDLKQQLKRGNVTNSPPHTSDRTAAPAETARRP